MSFEDTLSLNDRLNSLEAKIGDPVGDPARFAAIRDMAEPAFQLHGKTVTGPLPFETVSGYTGRLADQVKEFSPRWKNTDFTKVLDAAFQRAAVPEVFADAASPRSLPPGTLARVEVVDPYSGARRIEWRGDDDGATWRAFCNPLRIGKFGEPTKPAATTGTATGGSRSGQW